jgi:protein-tyrosine phosphatase
MEKDNIKFSSYVDYSEMFSDKPSKITTHIYQGNYEAAKNKNYLLSEGVTHILVAGRLEKYHPKDFNYKSFDIDDNYSENILKHFDEGYEFIDDCINKGGKILIHCAAGISRSSSFTLCYLIRKNQLEYKKAYELLVKARPIACPNPGFQEQLFEWERKYIIKK